MAPPPSLMTQQSSRWSGSEIIGEPTTSSTVTTSRSTACGLCSAWCEAATLIQASCSLVVPNWCMWRMRTSRTGSRPSARTGTRGARPGWPGRSSGRGAGGHALARGRPASVMRATCTCRWRSAGGVGDVEHVRQPPVWVVSMWRAGGPCSRPSRGDRGRARRLRRSTRRRRPSRGRRRRGRRAPTPRGAGRATGVGLARRVLEDARDIRLALDRHVPSALSLPGSLSFPRRSDSLLPGDPRAKCAPAVRSSPSPPPKPPPLPPPSPRKRAGEELSVVEGQARTGPLEGHEHA